jgi:hypothetical protein
VARLTRRRAPQNMEPGRDPRNGRRTAVARRLDPGGAKDGELTDSQSLNPITTARHELCRRVRGSGRESWTIRSQVCAPPFAQRDEQFRFSLGYRVAPRLGLRSQPILLVTLSCGQPAATPRPAGQGVR